MHEPSGKCEIVCSSSRRLEQETDEPSQLKDPASRQLKANVEALVGSAKHRLSPDEITAALVAGLKDAGVLDQLYWAAGSYLRPVVVGSVFRRTQRGDLESK